MRTVTLLYVTGLFGLFVLAQAIAKEQRTR